MSSTPVRERRAPKYRLARNIQDGYQIRFSDDVWLTVRHVIHITAPLKVSMFTFTNGEQHSAHPQDQIFSALPAVTA